MRKRRLVVVAITMFFASASVPSIGRATDSIVLYEKSVSPDAWVVGFKLPIGTPPADAIARVLEHLGRLTLRENFDAFAVRQMWDTGTSGIANAADVVERCTPVDAADPEPHCRLVVQVYKNSDDMAAAGSVRSSGRMDARRAIEQFRNNL